MIEFGFRGPVLIAAAYIASAVLLIAGPLMGTTIPLWIAIGLFSAWDISWLVCYASDIERTAQETLDSSTRARTYMSYYVAIYGAGASYFIFGLSKAQHQDVAALLRSAHLPPWLLVVPFVLSGVAILFFPVQLGAFGQGDLKTRGPSGANLAVVTVNAWVQKVATYVFIYSILMVLRAIWKQV